MTADRVSYYRLDSMSTADLRLARRQLAYADHMDTVSDAVAHWYDHIREQYRREREDNPQAFRKGAFLSEQRRRRWALKLNDARRAWQALR